MINISNMIIPDTLHGAIVLSAFDFVACFFVLYFISLFIKGIGYIDEKFPKSKDSEKNKVNKAVE